MTFLHFPNQFLRSLPTVKFHWQNRSTNHQYVLSFAIDVFEAIHRRNKQNSPCIEHWTNFDKIVFDAHAKQFKCRPSYWNNNITNMPICDTLDKLKRATFSLNSEKTFQYPPPCYTIEKLAYTAQEFTNDDGDFDDFWIGVELMNPQFKEIVQSRAVDFQTLVGNVGGYIGLLLGYSIIQLPTFLTDCYGAIRKFFDRILRM